MPITIAIAAHIEGGDNNRGQADHDTGDGWRRWTLRGDDDSVIRGSWNDASREQKSDAQGDESRFAKRVMHVS
jgi:hypothetical protein